MSGVIRMLVGEVQADGVVLTPAGVGYAVETPQPLEAGEQVTLWCTHIVNERGEKLYGFGAPQEREVFEALTAVRGVGGAMAIQIVAALGADGVRRAVANQDPKAIAAAKGIGAKTAELIVVSLADKLQAPPQDTQNGRNGSTNADKAVAALTRLGFDTTKARQAVEGQEDDATVEELVRGALVKLGGGHG